ncbi:MAG: MoxR family ATPase [Spirochaetes bacterium]|nr:MoxR family ATPase [Spirochaetota bacterium]
MKTTRDVRPRIQQALGGVILGQADLIDLVLIALLAEGHVLLQGLPGLAKTLLVRAVARLFDVSFNRVQFTPDLMPADLTGFELLDEKKGVKEMRFVEGPAFAHVLLADEINRTPPKTQAALLQAMQEGEVTVAGRRHPLPKPFLVLATQNPLEQEGTYPLPEAQLDRFLFLVKVGYPSYEDEVRIASLEGSAQGDPTAHLKPVYSREELLRMQAEAQQVAVAPEVMRWMVKLVHATRPESPFATDEVKEFVRVGASPRGSRLLVQAARAAAWLDGKKAVEKPHVERVLYPVLRHRLVLGYAAAAQNMDADRILQKIAKLGL